MQVHPELQCFNMLSPKQCFVLTIIAFLLKGILCIMFSSFIYFEVHVLVDYYKKNQITTFLIFEIALKIIIDGLSLSSIHIQEVCDVGGRVMYWY